MRNALLCLALVLGACKHDLAKTDPHESDVVSFDPRIVRKLLQDMSGGDVFVLKRQPTGMFSEFRDVVSAAKALDHEVVDAAPFSYTQVSLRHGAIVASGVLKGTSPSRMIGIVAKYVGDGVSPAGDTTDVALGVELANMLGVHVGDAVEVQIARDPSNGFDHESEFRSVRVSSLLRMGGLQLDYQLVVMNFSAAQRFVSRGDVASGVELQLAHDTAAHRVAKALETKLGDRYQATDWCELNRQLLGCTWHD
jgi:ABC-type lipoprotein release transport system permease subunit